MLSVRLVVGVGLALSAIGPGIVAQQQAQQGQPPPPPPPINQSTDPVLKRFVWRSIGPTAVGGRIDDITPDENDPSTFYIGYATGGVWKTTNNGTTFTPLFDEQPVTSIGDIAVSRSNPQIVYVGTGEPNNRQSSSFGAGIFKSTDGGKTFTFAGLKETQTIAKVVIHPTDPNIVYVAAVGHLFGPNPERGVFKTTDGGKTWTNTKFIDNDTGFIDLVIHPTEPNTLWAASYQRRRQPWGFNGGGPGSGIWQTTDGGTKWTRLMGNGLPMNSIIGRIGLDICRTKPNVILAQIEVGPSGGTGARVNDDGSLQPPGAGGGGGGGGGRGGGRGGRGEGPPPPPPDPDKTSGVWRSDDGGKSWKFMSNNNNRPMYYSKIRVDPNNDQIIYTLGAGASKSIDGGKTFQGMSGQSHGDHHTLWINPRNSNHLLIGNDGGIDVSYDQGATWEEISTMPTGQFYAISADMRKPYYVCGGLQDNGSWCGPSAVRNNTGSLITDWYRIGGGDGFYTQNDPSDWTIGYSESQDGNTNRYNLRTGATQSIRPSGPGQGRGGGGGGGGRGGTPDPDAPEAQQGGGRGGGGRGGGGAGNVVPPPPPSTFYRFYWNTPFILSPNDPNTVYLGGERVFKSTNRGDTWAASPDLTNNVGRNDRPIMGVDGKAPMASKHDGAASYSNVVTIGESPIARGVVWAGTNDGNVQVSRDGGVTWKNVVANVKGVPKETHVSRVEPSHFEAGTCYVTFDGHRTDDHKPYVFVTRDYGATWTSISSNLPAGNVNVIREDPKNRNLLYLGTEYAVFISQNGGKEWKKFMTGLPTVRIDDLLVHPRDNDLIVGTHGRSIWIIDDLGPLQQMTDAILTADAHVFDVRPATAWATDITQARGLGGAKHFRGQNPPGGAGISYYLKSVPSGDVKITITDRAGRFVRDMTGSKEVGLNRVQWNLEAGPTPEEQARQAKAAEEAAAAGRGADQFGRGAGGGGGRGGGGRGGRGGGGIPFAGNDAVAPGTYVVKLSVGGKELMTTVLVEADTFR
jgi:photosystem II stability/assembly factor-like uncharacterized protein